MLKNSNHQGQTFSMLRRSLYLLPLLYGGSLFAAIDVPVKIESGMIKGIPGSDAAVTQFLGIPFAAPPVGDMRWRPPQAAVPWPNIRTANRYSATCMQHVGGEGPTRPWTIEFNAHGFQSEDCLYLNVWTAAASPDERRPVLVYVHGGGNREGSSDIPIYNGEGLARKGLVVVTINYRLNILGFLAHPELTAESGYSASGNYGLMDQQAALRWVQQNIAAFGGDPAKVTVAGQSAGAGDMHYLTISPAAKGLFRGLIAQSGSKAWNDKSLPNPMTWLSLADAEQDGVKFAASLGAESLKDLRAMTWQQLMTSDVRVQSRAVVGGALFPEGFAATYAKGNHNDVPFLTGADMDEHGAEPHPDVHAAGFRQAVRERFGEMADAFLKLYPVASDADAPAAFNAVMRDYERASMYFWAVDRQKTSKTKAFTYYWTHAIPGPEADRWGAFHCSEIPYFLNTLSESPRPFETIDHQIAETMSAYYVNFVTTGDPNGNGLASWPAVDPASPVTMELGDHYRPIPVADMARLELLKKFFASQQEFR
ncbi:MAG: carboxylesterase family protein [Gammaproteobacteria bacterium]|nr:carboxylesterase family protein [Gammaproteobacteria bacterium]MDH3551492.1 carboxylesterase family protein [Gammaproteobacteria bacterium]